MAVVQISRIQIRRGQKNAGAGLPQLASGELAWAIDAQELYIGNGAVNEGAPQVGNTRILTTTDAENIFDLAGTYEYRSKDSFVQTGSTVTTPIRRSLQDRLDDIVSVKSFGATGDNTDQTVALQRAIDQLFLNSATKADPASRITLYIPAGRYVVSSTLIIPPFVHLKGDGRDKTIIVSTAVGPAFKTVNNTSTPGTPALEQTTSFTNQAKNILIEDMSVTVNYPFAGIELENCRDSVFRNVDFESGWRSGDLINGSSIAVQLNSLSTLVTCKNNLFDGCKFYGFGYGVESRFDVTDNYWNNCQFEELGFGVYFGNNTQLGSDGQLTGPIRNVFSDSIFDAIDRNGIYVITGNDNISQNNTFLSVGNLGGTESNNSHSIIKFEGSGNISTDDYFSRTKLLSYDQNFINGTPYTPEVETEGVFDLQFPIKLNVGQAFSPTRITRFPADRDKTFELNYTMKSGVVDMLRTGTMRIVVDLTNNNVTITDEYDHIGSSAYDEAVEFSVMLTNEGGGSNNTVVLMMENSIPSDASTISYRIKTLT